LDAPGTPQPFSGIAAPIRDKTAARTIVTGLDYLARQPESIYIKPDVPRRARDNLIEGGLKENHSASQTSSLDRNQFVSPKTPKLLCQGGYIGDLFFFSKL